MKSTNITEIITAQKEQKTQVLRSYSKPTLIKLGTVTDLTTGGSGHFGDVTGKTTPGPIQYP
jgi:hypothetical protein